MFKFLSKIVFGLIRFFFATVKPVYSFFANVVLVTSLTAIVAAPIFFLLYYYKEEKPLFIIYLAGAFIWPFVAYALLIAFLRITSNQRTGHVYSNQYSDAADEMLYGSNQPIYSPLSLVNSEIPCTNEHFTKYGSMD